MDDKKSRTPSRSLARRSLVIPETPFRKKESALSNNNVLEASWSSCPLRFQIGNSDSDFCLAALGVVVCRQISGCCLCCLGWGEGCCLCIHYYVWVGEKSSSWLQRIQSSYADPLYKDADVEKHLIQAPLYYGFDQEDPRIWRDSSTSEKCAARWWAKNSSVAPTTGSWRIW